MNIVRLLRRCHLPLVLLLGAFTPALFFLGRAYPQCIGWLPVFPAAYMLLAALLVSIPGRIRMPLFAAGCALLIGAGYLLFPDQPRQMQQRRYRQQHPERVQRGQAGQINQKNRASEKAEEYCQ